MSVYVVTNKERNHQETVRANSISSNMGGVLFFHCKTGRTHENTLPKEIDRRDVIEELEITYIAAPGEWACVQLQNPDRKPSHGEQPPQSPREQLNRDDAE